MATQADMRRSRAALLCSTALVGVSLAMPAAAQPAPNARPTGGQVVAGGAQIGQTAAATTVTQSTPRAAVDWRSFDVGANHSVTFAQPSAQAVILNRVTGPDPSAIAGQVSANGQVIITNPSGVVFHRGAQVNAAGIVVSAPGITNQNFMAGRMVFDQAPKRDARVENHGTITVKQAGLAALVAPAVVNSGTINARMGRAVLAGAAAHTLDLYGDGLVSLDVTSQVREAPRGADGQPVAALVTNTGTVRADGGVVQLTAAAADGVVSTLVRSGGRVQANTAEGRTGRVEISGTGGSVIVEGRVAADGRAPGSTGGEVAVAASGMTGLANTARVSASGRAGGGTVAIGTTPARARTLGAAPAGTSARTLVAAGARVSADATRNGAGGRVTVLSTNDTRVAGTLTARGGRDGGDGGTVELSGAGRFSLTGTADTSAPKGRLGTVVIDPFNLDIVAGGTGTVTPADDADPNLPATGGGGPGTTDTVTRAAIEGLTGNVRLQATNNITVRTSLTLAPLVEGTRSLTLEAGNNLTVEAGTTLKADIITLSAAGRGVTQGIPGSNPEGALIVAGNLESTLDTSLNAGTGGIRLSGALTVGAQGSRSLNINTTGPLTQAIGSIAASELSGESASVSLLSPANRIRTVGRFSQYEVTGSAASDGFALTDSVDLTIGSTSPGGGISVQPGRTVTLTQVSPTTNAVEIRGNITAGIQGDATAPPANTTTPAANVAAPRATVSGRVNLVLSAPAGVEITSGAKTPGLLSVTTGELSRVAGSTLTLQSTSPGGTGRAGTVTLGKPGEVVNLAASGGFTALDLQASGAVTQGAGFEVSRVTGRAGTLDLRGDNSVQELAGFTTTGNLAFRAGRSPLLVSGPVVAGGGAADVELSSAGSVGQNMTLAADVRGAAVTLGSIGSDDIGINGNIAQTDGVITAGTLNIAGRSATLISQNQVTNLGIATTDAGLSLTNGRALGIAGNVTNTTGTVAFTAPSILQAPTSTLATPTLNSASLSAAYNSPTNRVAALGTVQATGGTFSLATTLTNAVPLSIGTVNATNGQATFVADQVTQAGPITASNGLVRFAPLTPGRRIELVAGSAADFSDRSPPPSIASPAAGPNALSLSQALLDRLNVGTLALGGPGTSGAITIGNPGEAISLAGRATTLQLQTTGAVTQGAGATLAVPDLVGSTGSLALGNANAIGSLGLGNAAPGTLTGYATTGALAFATASALDVGNGISSGGPLSLQAGGSLTANGTLSAPAITLASTSGSVLQTGGTISTPGTLTLSASGDVAQTLGTISASTLTGQSRTLSLPGAALSNLGPYTTTGAFQLGNAGPLTVTGAVQTGDAAVTLGTGGLRLDADLRGNAVRLAAPGAITQGAGILSAGTLTGTAGSVDLQGANQVGTLGAFAATGAVSLANAGSLRVAGPVSAGAAALNVSGGLELAGALSAPTVALTATGGITQTAGLVSAPTQLSLTAGGGVAQTGGSIATGLLTGSAAFLDLPSRANEAAAVGPFLTTGNFLLYNNRSLAVVGTIDPGNVTMDVVGDLRLDAPVIGTTVTLRATGAITEGQGGLVEALTLTGSADRADLSGVNRVSGLGGFTTANGFTLNTARSLGVTGAVLDGQSITVRSGGSLFLNGTVSAPAVSLTATGVNETTAQRGGIFQSGGLVAGDTVSLTAAGNISQTFAGFARQAGARITAGTLTGSSGGSTSLPDGRNAVTTLGAFSSVGGFSLSNGRSLAVSGPLSDPARIGLSVTGDLQLQGTLSTASLVTAATGAITQPGGAIQAQSLSGRAGSAGFDRAGNDIAALGPFTTTRDFSLTDGTALAVAGAVSAGTGSTLGITADALSFGASGTLSAPGGTVWVAALSPAGLTFDVSAAPRIAATTLVLGTPTGGPVLIRGPLDLPGIPVLDLQSAGALSQSGGGILVGTLTGAGASAALDGPNRIGTLGRFTTTGALSLTNAADLAVAGPLQAQSLSLSATGRLTLAGGTLAADSAVLRATGPAAEVLQTGTTTVLPFSGTSATLRIELPATGGTVALNDLRAAPAALTLALGTGRATGALQAGSLLVEGAGGSAGLSGSVAGRDGFAAAETSRISPRFDTGYLLNGCAIQSASCVVTPPPPPSTEGLTALIAPQTFLRPLFQNLNRLEITVTRDRDDPNILLPNISDRDY